MRNLIFLLQLLLCGFSITAQDFNSLGQERLKNIIRKTDKQSYNTFYRTRPLSSKDGEVGRYFMTDNGNRFLFQPFGYIKPIMGWDIGNSIDDIGFVPAEIPVPAKRGNQADFLADPLHSALGMHVIGLPGTKYEIVGFIKVMFNAPKSVVQLHNVYIGYRGFVLGRNSSLFEDGESMPETIDPQGPNGAVSTHAYLVSWSKNFKSGFGIGVSIELPTFDKYPGKYYGKDYPDLDGTQFYGNATQPVPDIPFYIQYKGKGKNRIRLSGIFRDFYYRNQLTDDTKSLLGWGVQLSGNIQPIESLLFYYQCTYGHGIANYIQDLSCLTISYIPRNNRPGLMSATPMMGWLGGFEYSFANRLKCNAVYSMARVWGSSDYDSYRMGNYLAVNAFYPIRNYLLLGVEYLWGSRVDFGDKRGSLNRIQTALKLNF